MPLPVKGKSLPERNIESNNGQSSKPLVILAKPPDKTKNVENPAQTTTSNSVVQHELKPPTVLQKSRDGTEHDASRSASPGMISPSMSQNASPGVKDSETFTDFVKNVSHRVFHIQQKPPSSATGNEGEKILPPPEMITSAKLIDETQQWCDSALEYLHDGADFYVIGVIGLQGTGKSTILSAIAGSPVFKVQNQNMKTVGEHCTSGIDVFVTNQRLILLDTQPLLSPSFMDQMIQYDKKKFFEEKKPLGSSDYYSAESNLYIQSMQLVIFLMSVCHTIISVQDWFIDLNYIRFILSCEMLKPPKLYQHDLKSIHDGVTEYFPNFVFVQNKCQRFEFSKSLLTKMKKSILLLFQSSNMNFFGSISPEVNSDQQNFEDQGLNLFLLPVNENPEDEIKTNEFLDYKGHASFNHMCKSLSRQVLSMPRNMMTNTAASEKNWFHYSARIWDTIKKINIFDEYRRHLVSIS